MVWFSFFNFLIQETKAMIIGWPHQSQACQPSGIPSFLCIWWWLFSLCYEAKQALRKHLPLPFLPRPVIRIISIIIKQEIRLLRISHRVKYSVCNRRFALTKLLALNSVQLIKPKYLASPPTGALPKFLKKITSFSHKNLRSDFDLRSSVVYNQGFPLFPVFDEEVKNNLSYCRENGTSLEC